MVRWGVLVALLGGFVLGMVVLVVLVQSFLGPVLGYRCDVQARPLVDMNSMDDLRGRFNDDAGSPRLVLLLSPT